MSRAEHDADGPASEDSAGTHRLGLHRLVEPAVLFTLIAVAGLGAIWGVAVNFAQRDLEAAEREARTLVLDQANTYEAQMVRALREIDQGLKLIRHQLQSAPPKTTLRTLSNEGLLPPEFLFTFSILDTNGSVLATTGTARSLDGDVPASTRETGSLVISQPWQGSSGDDWRLRFALPPTTPREASPARSRPLCMQATSSAVTKRPCSATKGCSGWSAATVSSAPGAAAAQCRPARASTTTTCSVPVPTGASRHRSQSIRGTASSAIPSPAKYSAIRPASSWAPHAPNSWPRPSSCAAPTSRVPASRA